MMLIDNAMVLRAQLETIDSNYFRCIDTIHSTPDEISTLLRFLLPSVAPNSPFLDAMVQQVKFKKEEERRNITLGVS